jgi:murein DD-endopeptidase MepM/ murein hydrolase activator NlpD
MRSRVVVLLALVAVPALLWAVLPVPSAGSPGSIQRKIDRKKAQIGTQRGREQVLTQDISAYSRQIGALQGEITTLQARETRLQASLDAKRAQLAQVQERLRQERLRLARLRARLAEARVALANRLVQIYKADKPDVVTVVLESDGFADLLERTEFMQRVSAQDARIIAEVRAAKAEATATADRLATLERREAAVAATIQGERDQVAGVKGQLVARRSSYAQARDGKRTLLARTQEHRHELEGDLAGLVKEQAAIRARLAASAAQAPSAAAGPIRQGSGGLIWPVNGPITSPFCESRAWESCHPGIDIGVSAGTTVRAAAAGRVALVQSEAASGGYGNFICVQHTSAMSTCYAHLSSFAASMGASVSQGQVIAYSGCTGRCYGDHLHFEVRINGAVTNPLNYL